MRLPVPALVSALLLAGPLVVRADVITLNFEGIAPYPNDNDVLIENYYDGGAASNGAIGPNYGVTFSSGATLLCLNSLTVDCSNTSKGGSGVAGSEFNAMYFPTTNPYMDVAAGFTTGFSMAYTNPFDESEGINIYSGVDGTGTLLASASLPGTPDGATACPGYDANYCPFEDFSVAFSGTAMSIEFTGAANSSTYDDFTFGSTTVGGGGGVSASEPGTLALLGLGLAALGALGMRRRRAAS